MPRYPHVAPHAEHHSRALSGGGPPIWLAWTRLIRAEAAYWVRHRTEHGNYFTLLQDQARVFLVSDIDEAWRVIGFPAIPDPWEQCGILESELVLKHLDWLTEDADSPMLTELRFRVFREELAGLVEDGLVIRDMSGGLAYRPWLPSDGWHPNTRPDYPNFDDEPAMKESA